MYQQQDDAETNSEISTLDDLEVNEEVETDLKGGPGGYGTGGVLINHNETVTADFGQDDTETNSETFTLDDLEVNEEVEADLKGGPGGYSSGGVLINHNETMTEDLGAKR